MILAAFVAGAPGLRPADAAPSAAGAASSPAVASASVAGHVSAQLVAARTALVPGATTMLALDLQIAPGWHTYWRNPGESGLPTTLVWKLPPGFVAGDIEWPAPQVLKAGPLVNYGYEGEVLHLVPIAVPRDAKPGTTATLAARADWLVCKETCIPEGADLALALPIATVGAPDPHWSEAIETTRAALPRPQPAWSATAVASGSTIALTLTPPPGAADPGALQFFAEAENRIEPSVAQLRTAQGGSYVLSLPISHQMSGGFARLRGVLTASRGRDSTAHERDAMVHAIALDLPLAGAPTAGPKPVVADAAIDLSTPAGTERANLTLPVAIVFALAGGILLNLMPCVFPVLSLKALRLATSGGDDRRVLRHEGLAFSAGVVIAFSVLGAVIVALRAGGAQLGWGFQLQSPAVVSVLAILFFVMALNLSGMFEFGALVPSRVATWSHANRHANAFGSGVLAVAIASPCSAPFMGAALGYALGADAHVTLGIFIALGIGMALPYFALACFPQWRRVLPRPGPWMERLRQLLAFPLYATVAWLAWVLGAQVGNDGVLRIGAVLVLTAFALWAWRTWRSAARGPWRGIAAASAVAGLVVVWPLLAGAHVPSAELRAQASALRADGWEAYSSARVAESVDQGRPVFVDFTAAWCITCQVNERLVLNSARVRDAFARSGTVRLRADWTRRDARITEALAALGRSGVPVYVLYRKGRPPQLLPEVLRRSVVVDALSGR